MWGAILTAVGAGISLFAKKKESDAAKDAARANAEAAKKEAEYQEWKSEQELAEFEEYKTRFVARQTVAFAKAGINIDEGTAVDVAKDTMRQYNRDRQILALQGKFNIERAQTGVAIAEESLSAARMSGYLGMGRTLLSGAYSVGKAWGAF